MYKNIKFDDDFIERVTRFQKKCGIDSWSEAIKILARERLVKWEDKEEESIIL